MAVAPRIGTVMNGYIFRGGDASSPDSWTPDLGSKISPDERKELTGTHTASANARRAAGQAREFMSLNERKKTGGFYAIPGVSEIAGGWDADISTLQGLSNRMLPNMHVTPGPMTDADAKMYRSAVPNPNYPRAANRALTRGIETQDAELRAKAAYYDKYARVHGTLRGADAGFADFWGQYQASPPAPPLSPSRPRQAAPAQSSRPLVYDPRTGDFR